MQPFWGAKSTHYVAELIIAEKIILQRAIKNLCPIELQRIAEKLTSETCLQKLQVEYAIISAIPECLVGLPKLINRG